MATNIEAVPIHRLRSECLYFGIRSSGMSRNDLVLELKNIGLYEIDMKYPAKPPKIDISNRKDDLSNTLIGNGAGVDETRSNRLYIANDNTSTPLIGGDFKTNRVEINDVLNISSNEFESDTLGEEGDLRRIGSQLYMYRCTKFHNGWYPILFGPVLVI